jgi:hypothetical protein
VFLHPAPFETSLSINNINMTNFKEQYARLGMKIPKTKNLAEKAELIYVASCAKLGIDPLALPNVSHIREKYQAKTIADYKLMIVRDAITEEREADWDSNEYKYGGWFWMNKPGFRFYGSGCGISGTLATGGSRLCTFSEEDQEFFMQECVAFWADSFGGKLPA